MSPSALLGLRLLLAVIWLYNGLVLKILMVDPEHLSVVEAVGGFAGLSPSQFLTAIGMGETLLALGILSGIAYRQLCVFQFVLIVAMNLVGIASGGVADAAGLVITNLPLLACILIAGSQGPGALHGGDDD